MQRVVLRQLLPALIMGAGLALPHAAEARFAIAIGDLVFADGQTFSYEEYEEYKKTHPADGNAPAAPPQQQQQQQQQQYQASPAYQAYQPAAPQYQAPSTGSIVNGYPVVTIAPPTIAPALPMDGSVAALPQSYPTYVAAPGAGTAPALRAASCRTTKAYSEFPADGERFDCGAAGQLTRPEMLAQGWKIDFVEKLPTGSDALSAYKIMLSR